MQKWKNYKAYEELIVKRTDNEPDSKQVLSVIEKYSNALDLLDSYDHQNMTRPKGNEATYVLKYEECMEVIQTMRCLKTEKRR